MRDSDVREKRPTLVLTKNALQLYDDSTDTFAGGSGFAGRTAVRWFQDRYPRHSSTVGGRNLQAASEVAQEVGAAEAVAIDLDKPRLGLDMILP